MKKGFTLAEVLVTLAIIGVVASMSIPGLIEKQEKQGYVTGLKKFYAETNQALQRMAADYGCTGDLECTGIFASENDSQARGDILVKYFNVSKNCGVSLTGGCFSDKVSEFYDGHGSRVNYYNNQEEAAFPAYKFITANGMSISIASDSFDCSPSRDGICSTLFVDINGLKGPNNFGRDLFGFEIHKNRGLVVSNPVSDSYVGCLDPNPMGSNLTCAARIMEEGWEMTY